VQPYEIYAQAPQPLGDPLRVLRFGEVGAECQIYAEKPDPAASGRYKAAIGYANLVGLRQRGVQEAEIRCAHQIVLVHTETVEAVLGQNQLQDQDK